MIDLEIQGLERVRKQLTAAPREIDRRRRATLAKAGVLVRDEARRRIHSPSGKARRGVRSFVQGGDERAIIRPGNKAAVFSQRTRRPGQTPPSLRAARAIARHYGIPPEHARRLALAIGRRGTKGKPVMVDALRATRREIEAVFKREVLEPVVAFVTGR